MHREEWETHAEEQRARDEGGALPDRDAAGSGPGSGRDRRADGRRSTGSCGATGSKRGGGRLSTYSLRIPNVGSLRLSKTLASERSETVWPGRWAGRRDSWAALERADADAWIGALIPARPSGRPVSPVTASARRPAGTGAGSSAITAVEGRRRPRQLSAEPAAAGSGRGRRPSRSAGKARASGAPPDAPGPRRARRSGGQDLVGQAQVRAGEHRPGAVDILDQRPERFVAGASGLAQQAHGEGARGRVRAQAGLAAEQRLQQLAGRLGPGQPGRDNGRHGRLGPAGRHPHGLEQVARRRGQGRHAILRVQLARQDLLPAAAHVPCQALFEGNYISECRGNRFGKLSIHKLIYISSGYLLTIGGIFW